MHIDHAFALCTDDKVDTSSLEFEGISGLERLGPSFEQPEYSLGLEQAWRLDRRRQKNTFAVRIT